MSPSRPYLLRALYEWVCDNNMTPYITVDTAITGVAVPQQFIKDGKITLNISHRATKELRIGNDAVEFKTRFGSRISHIYIPMPGVIAIYAFESKNGMSFSPQDIQNYQSEENTNATPTTEVNKNKSKKPLLRIVKEQDE